MSLPAPGILSTASKNLCGMKWVYASMRMSGPPDGCEWPLGLAAGRAVGVAREGTQAAARCQAGHLVAVIWLRSFGRDAEVGVAFDVGEAPRERFAFGVDEGGGAGARNGVDPARHWHSSRQHRTDHPGLDFGIARRAALQGVAVALDQPCALSDFKRQRGGFGG